MRLSRTAVLPADVVLPKYDRSAQKAGIVHFGIGAFHRAHQAVYTDDAMNAGDRDWGIIGVSLRSPTVAAQMNPQDGIYSVTERSKDGDKTRVIGAVKKVLVAANEPDALIAALASRDTHIVSFTITEKGYCRAPDGTLDFAQADDRSVYAYLAAAMQRRRASKLGGLTLLSCDNLASNGAQLAELMRAYLQRCAPDLVSWFEDECTCPSTMVDRIVPATTDDDRQSIAGVLGGLDEAAVVTEPFTQWVIEDNFAGRRPCWEVGGAQFTEDVVPFETAKLRMLNGAHSALAYIGLQKGHEFVHQAVADPYILKLANILMREEAATSLKPAGEQNLASYADALIARFANPALNHRLIQIAMDGSQKIPQRWLETLAFHQKQGRQCPAILEAVAAWIIHIRGTTHVVEDPMRDTFKALWETAGAAHITSALFGHDGQFAPFWLASQEDIALVNHRVCPVGVEGQRVI
ncbi:mannitol dehydrogenase family protein [Sphingorhabdus sp.]|uniref:mannitol dehydrogenase family protein n=1 Tax=Sphingorhabdus sp. TaxID=1902408 RepID=UPI00391D67BF